ncbi:MAG: hypothetical protein PHY47_00170 [Lachnospiraceae bacterium]|nr:hypothetical protein [Lachnospiraceae bacterium]
MYRKHEEYIDTASQGNIIMVEHNLGSLLPSITLYEPINLSDLKAVSLYDSRIASIESRGPNVTRITFSNAFQGYIQLIDIQNVRTTIADRITHLEELTDLIIQQQKQLVNSAQWRQMNTYHDNQAAILNKKIVELGLELTKLKNDVAAL